MMSVGNKKGSSLVPHKVLFCFATYTLCVVYTCTKLYQNIHYNLRNLLKIPSESINIYQQKGAGQSCLVQQEAQFIVQVIRFNQERGTRRARYLFSAQLMSRKGSFLPLAPRYRSQNYIMSGKTAILWWTRVLWVPTFSTEWEQY